MSGYDQDWRYLVLKNRSLLLRLWELSRLAKYQTRDYKFEVYYVIYESTTPSFKSFANIVEHFMYNYEVLRSFHFES